MHENVPSDDSSIPAELNRALEHIRGDGIVAAGQHIAAAAEIVSDTLAPSGSELAGEIKGLLDAAGEHASNALSAQETGRRKITEYIADLAAGTTAETTQGSTASTVIAGDHRQRAKNTNPEKPQVEETYIDRTYKNIEDEVAETWRKMQAGEEVDRHVADNLSGSLHTVLRHALELGDIPKAESFLMILRQLKDKLVLAEACYAIGTEKAFTILHEEMEAAQKRRVQEYLRIMEEEPATGLLGLLSKAFPDLMKSVIIECRNRGISADSWIEKYSINNQEKWVRHWQYYQPISEDFTALSATPDVDQQGIEKLANDYLADETQEPHVVHAQLRKVIKHIKDPGLKERLFQRYMAGESSASYDLQILGEHYSLGIHMLGQPSCTDEMVEAFTSSIDRVLADMVKTGEYSEIQRKIFKLEWNVQVGHRYRHEPVAETVKPIKDLVQEILKSDMPDNITGTGITIVYDIRQLLTKRAALTNVNSRVTYLAKECALAGDFKSAATFAAASWDSRLATSVCLLYAHTNKDLKYFKPDDLEAMVSDTKARQIRLSGAMEADDTDALAADVQEAVTGPKPEGYEDKNVDRFVVAALEHLISIDPQRGMALVKTARDRLHDGEISGDYWDISRILIENGDKREIANAYNLIERSFTGNPAAKLIARQWLVQTVERVRKAKKN